MYHNLLKNRVFLCGIALVGVFMLAAIFAPLLTPYAPDTIDQGSLLTEPNADHWFGTDALGRDVFSRVLFGARISLAVGFIVVIIATAIGLFLGSLSGYYGGFVDYLIMRFTDIMLCFPVFFLILAVIALLEPSVFNIIFILGVTSWMGQARFVRAEILALKTREFVLASKAYGASAFWVISRHLVPNAMGPVLVSAILGVASAILAESALSFLGIGIQPPTPSWGNMLSDAKSTLGIAWWLSLYPGLAIFLTILGFNLLGEGIRECMLKKGKMTS